MSTQFSNLFPASRGSGQTAPTARADVISMPIWFRRARQHHGAATGHYLIHLREHRASTHLVGSRLRFVTES